MSRYEGDLILDRFAPLTVDVVAVAECVPAVGGSACGMWRTVNRADSGPDMKLSWPQELAQRQVKKRKHVMESKKKKRPVLRREEEQTFK